MRAEPSPAHVADAERREAAPRDCRQVGVIAARAAGPKRACRARIAVEECLTHVVADFEGVGADRRAEPGDERFRLAVERGDGRLDDAVCESAPSRVRDANPIARPAREETGRQSATSTAQT